MDGRKLADDEFITFVCPDHMRFVPFFPDDLKKKGQRNYLSRFKNDYWKELVFKEREESWLNRKQKHFHSCRALEEIVTTPEEEVKRAVMVGDTTVMIDDVHYEIVEDYRIGFNIEALNEL